MNYNGGGSTQTTPVPAFSTVFSGIISESSAYSGLAANGTVTIPTSSPAAASFNISTLNPNGMAVFTVDGNTLLNNSYVQQMDINLNSTTPSAIIINVTGTNITYSNSGNFVGNLNSATWRPKIIWNFYEATSITMNQGFSGCILAPFATLNANSGALEGSVAVANLTTSVEVHLPLFNGTVTGPGPTLGFRRPARHRGGNFVRKLRDLFFGQWSAAHTGCRSQAGSHQ